MMLPHIDYNRIMTLMLLLSSVTNYVNNNKSYQVFYKSYQTYMIILYRIIPIIILLFPPRVVNGFCTSFKGESPGVVRFPETNFRYLGS